MTERIIMPDWAHVTVQGFPDRSIDVIPTIIDPFSVSGTREMTEEEERRDDGRVYCFRHSDDFTDETTLDPKYHPCSNHGYQDFQQGMTVEMVNPMPYFSRGPVRLGDFGRVTHIIGGVMKVKFYYMSTWSGIAGDFKIVLEHPQYKVGALVRPLKHLRTENQKVVTRSTAEGIITSFAGNGRYVVYFPSLKDKATVYAHDLVVMGNSNKDVKRILNNI